MKQNTKDLQLCIEADLHAYENACNDLGWLFSKKYFEGNTDWDWMSEIGGCLNINDYYFSFDDVVFALKQKVTIKKLFEWYDYHIDSYETGKEVNFNNYLKGAK